MKICVYAISKNEALGECFSCAMRALRIVDRQMVYTCDPAVWGHWAHDLAAIAAWNMGMKDIAREQAERALALSPDDVRLAANLHFMRGDQEEKAA